jgi:hypothetical protein
MLTVAQLIRGFSTAYITGRFVNAVTKPAIVPDQNQLNLGLSHIISSGSFLILYYYIMGFRLVFGRF